MSSADTASGPKRILVHILMVSIFLLLAAFSAWLLWLTYFASYRTGAALAKRAIPRQDIAVAPFHGLDESVNALGKSTSWCLKCHEDLPHVQAERVRGMLNAHSFFLACEVCHLTPKEGERFDYKWLQRGGNTALTELKGKPGEYGGMIVPFATEGGTARRLDENPAAAGPIEEYQALKARLREAGESSAAGDLKRQLEQLKTETHKSLTSKPIVCEQCHKQNGPLDFVKLMYPPQRAQRLTFGEGAAVFSQYQEFHLPSLTGHAHEAER